MCMYRMPSLRKPMTCFCVFLHREHLRKRFVYTNQDVEEFCLLLCAFARPVSGLPSLQVSRNPADDYVIATAVTADVSYVVRSHKTINYRDCLVARGRIS